MMRIGQNSMLGIAAAGALLLVLAGCAGEAGTSDEGGSELPPAGTALAEAAAGRDVLSCGEFEVSREAIEERRSVEALDETRRLVLEQAMFDTEGGIEALAAQGWFVVEDSPGSLVVLRELEATDPDISLGVQRNYAIMAVSAWNAPSIEEGWMPTWSGSCLLHVKLDGLGEASVWLDPTVPLDPESREVRLWLVEQDCAGGEPAEGRVEVVGLVEDKQQIAVVLGVRPQGGPCPSNPATPFVLQLEHPIGDREIIDATLASPRELVPMPDGGPEPRS